MKMKNLNDEQFDEITELIVPFFIELNAEEYYFLVKMLQDILKNTL